MMWGIALMAVALLAAAAALLLLARARERPYDAQSLLRARLVGSDALLARAAAPPPAPVRALLRLLQSAGIELADDRAQGLLLGLCALLVALPLLLGIVAGLFIDAIVVVSLWGLVQRASNMRRLKLLEQLPSFLETVMRVLSAGNTLEESLQVAAKESPDPIQNVFLSVTRQVRLGASVEQVLTQVGDIHRLRELKVIALAAAINRKYGGSLRNILKSVVTAIRTRGTAAREVKALTAETRFSALVLAVIPIGLTVFILARNAAYYREMWLDPSGRALLMGSVALQIAGVAIIWRMINRSLGPEA